MDGLAQLPSILLMGLKKSGKTSIQKVVFERLMPYDTATLPTTTIMEARRVDGNKFVRFEVWDCPGQTDALNSEDARKLLQSCGAIVFVVDSTERLEEPQERLIKTISIAQQQNAELHIEVFVHKTDLLNENQQHELVRRLSRAVEDSFKAEGGKSSKQVSYYRTSIYDHSVFRAFSVVVQRLVKRQQGYICSLLASLSSHCKLQIVYLFMSKTKIFVAEDQADREIGDVYEICSDALDMMTRLDGVYRSLGSRSRRSNENQNGDHHHHHSNGGHGEDDDTAEDDLNERCSSVIHLSDANNPKVIYVREIPNDLTVVMILPESELVNRALIDYNLTVFSSSATAIFDAGQQFLTQHRSGKSN